MEGHSMSLSSTPPFITSRPLVPTLPQARLTRDQIRPGKERLQRIVRMLMGLIKRNSTREYGKDSPPPEQNSSSESSSSSSS